MMAGVSAALLSTGAIKSFGLLSLPVAGLLGLSGVSALAYRAWSRQAAEPFIPPSLWRNRGYLACCGVMGMANAGRFGGLILVPIFLTELNGTAPLAVGAVLFPSALIMIVTAPRAGRAVDRRGPAGSSPPACCSRSLAASPPPGSSGARRCGSPPA